VFDAVEGLFADVEPGTPAKMIPAPPAGRVRMKLFGRRTEQAHVCIGWRGVPQEHPDKYGLDMLNAILGEGMSSRLFLELREKRALAYDVHSYGTNFIDAGHMVVYAGVTPERISEVIQASLSEVAKMRDVIVPEEEIERVRDFNKGRLELRLEDSRGVSNWLAGQELFLGRVRTVDEVCAIIDSISAADVQRVARQYLRPELSYIAAVGPRAAIANVNVPGADVVDMEIAS
jgi:predicted Zn-dependent peptidase